MYYGMGDGVCFVDGGFVVVFVGVKVDDNFVGCDVGWCCVECDY